MARPRKRPVQPELTREQPALPNPLERVAGLNSRRKSTFEAIFEKPSRPDIRWRDIESLFEALGGEITAGQGSRRRVALNGRRAVFHEPHPERVTDKGAVDSVREFLVNAGFSR